jgi:WD40 repeat protein
MSGRKVLSGIVLSLFGAACAAGYVEAGRDESPAAVLFDVKHSGAFKSGPTKSHDGKLTVKADGRQAQMVEVATGTPVGPALGHADIGRTKKLKMTWAFSPDGKLLATAFSGDTVCGGDSEGDVRVWEVATGKLVTASKRGDIGYVRSLAFNPDNKTLVIDCEEVSGK